MSEKWNLLLKFDKSGLATNDNGADIPDNMLQTATHCVFDKKALEVASGRTAKYAQLESGVGIDGIFRSWDKLGNKDTLVACNGKIKYDTGSAWGDLLSGLTAGVDYDFKNWKDRTFIINGTDDAREFFPRTNAIQKAGLEPPRFYKKVAYFETDETINTGDTGVAVDTVTFRPTERTGNNSRSLKLTATAGTTVSGYVTYGAAQNFSIFPNAGSVSDNDFICVSIFHRTRAYVSAITIDFYTSSGNYYRAKIDVGELDPIIQRNNQWTDIKIQRKRFLEYKVGSPAWNNITRVYCNLTSVTGSAVVNFDNIYIKNAPIKAVSYGKEIESFDDMSIWSCTECTPSNNTTYYKQGSHSVKFAISGAKTAVAYHANTIDLGYHVDSVASPLSDEITCWIYGKTTNLTSIRITFETTGDDPYFVWLPGDDGLNESGSDGWSQIRAAKSEFENSTSDWSSVTKVTITIITVGSCNLYFDDLKLDEKSLEMSILTMEPSENWAFSNAGSYNTNQKYRTEGDSSVFVKVPAKKSYSTSAEVAIDLTEFAGGEVSSTDDYICFWMMWTNFNIIQKIEMQIDIDDKSFTDYMSYEITPAQLVTLLGLTGKKISTMNGLSTAIEIAKSDFTRVGVEPAVGWNTVAAVKFTVYGVSKGAKQVTVYFDDLHMRRKTGLTGIYQFACVFVNANNEPSGLSEWSEQVELSGSRAVLSLIPLSQDASCVARWLFRKGGSLGEDARLDEVIWDNTTTTYYTGIADYETGILASDISIPQGTIRFPSITKFGPTYKNRLTGFGDAEHPEYLYFTNTDFWYAWSELQAWRFDSKILDSWVDDDVLFVNTHLGIRRIRVDLGEITADDIEEIGVVKHSMGPWASCSVEGSRAFVSYDGVYLMNGSQVTGPISEPIENYFTGSTYTLASTKAIYRNKHLYLSILATATRSMLDCYMNGLQWRTSDYPIKCFCIFDGPSDTQQLYGGTTDGYIYQLDTGYASTLAVVTKDYPVSDNPFDEVVLDEIWVKVRSAESGAGSINVQFRINQAIVTDLTFSIPSSGDIATVYTSYFRKIREYEGYLKGSKIGLSIVPSVAGKHLAIESILLKGTITGMPKELEE